MFSALEPLTSLLFRNIFYTGVLFIGTDPPVFLVIRSGLFSKKF